MQSQLSSKYKMWKKNKLHVNFLVIIRKIRSLLYKIMFAPNISKQKVV